MTECFLFFPKDVAKILIVQFELFRPNVRPRKKLCILDELRSEGKLLEGSVLGVHDPKRNFFLHNAIRQNTFTIIC